MTSYRYCFIPLLFFFFFFFLIIYRVYPQDQVFALASSGRRVKPILAFLFLFVSGTYIVQKQSFISLDSLRNIPYDVTETSNRIFNNIISLSISQSDLLVQYIKALKDLSLYFVPGVNVSSPEMP